MKTLYFISYRAFINLQNECLHFSQVLRRVQEWQKTKLTLFCKMAAKISFRKLSKTSSKICLTPLTQNNLNYVYRLNFYVYRDWTKGPTLVNDSHESSTFKKLILSVITNWVHFQIVLLMKESFNSLKGIASLFSCLCMGWEQNVEIKNVKKENVGTEFSLNLFDRLFDFDMFEGWHRRLKELKGVIYIHWFTKKKSEMLNKKTSFSKKFNYKTKQHIPPTRSRPRPLLNDKSL